MARALSKLGYCSRSAAFELIRSGRVHLNGRLVRDPEAPVRLDKDRIAVDGRSIPAAAKVYLALNKPRGVVTTASDEKDRETVYRFVEPGSPWVAPVGRLDKASEGLLMLTNDSEWAARVLAPQSHLDKVYHVQIGRVAGEPVMAALAEGVRSEGELLRVKKVCVLRSGAKNCWLEIVLDEGKNRQIRRMFAALQIEVLRLVRVAIGPVILADLAKGQVRRLSASEKEAMERSMAQARDRKLHRYSP